MFTDIPQPQQKRDTVDNQCIVGYSVGYSVHRGGEPLDDEIIVAAQDGCSGTWDGTDRSGYMVSAGIYFVQFSSPDYVRTEKSVFLR